MTRPSWQASILREMPGDGRPIFGDGGVPMCDGSCPEHDGKRCKLLGLRPASICELAVVEMATALGKATQ